MKDFLINFTNQRDSLIF